MIFLVKVKLVIEPSSKRAVQWFNKSFELLEPLPEKAKIASFTFSKSIRRSNKQFIAVTCHYDLKIGLNQTGYSAQTQLLPNSASMILCANTSETKLCVYPEGAYSKAFEQLRFKVLTSNQNWIILLTKKEIRIALKSSVNFSSKKATIF